MKSALITILFLYAASRCGRHAMKLLRVREWAGGMSALYETGAGMWLLSMVLLALSAAGRCDSRAILGFLVAAAFVCAAIDVFLLLGKKSAPAAPAETPASTQPAAPPRPDSAKVPVPAKNIFTALSPIFLLILFISIFNNIFRCFIPPVDFDALSYHLAVPHQYLLAGKLIALPTILYSNFPLAAEMMFLPGLAARAPASAALIHTAFGIMTAALIYTWMKNHFSSETALLGAAIFYLTPLVGTVSPAPLVDLTVTFYSFAAIAALLTPYHDKHAVSRYATAALFAGIAASVKWPGALILFMAAAYISYNLLFSRNNPTNGVPPRPRSGLTAANLLPLIAIGVLSLVPVAPYLIKNAVFSGNPVYPMLFGIFGGKDLDRDTAAAMIQGVREHARSGSLFLNFFLAPWNMAMKESAFQGVISPVYLCLVPLYALVRKNRAASFALAFALLYYPMWYFLLNLSLRLFMPALPLLAIAAAYTACSLCELRLGKLAAAVVALNLCLGLGAGIFGSAGLKANLPVILGRVSDDAFISDTLPEYKAIKWINSNAWPDDRAMLGEILVKGYYLDIPYVWAHPVFQGRYRYGKMRGGDDLYTALRRDGVSLILFRLNKDSLNEMPAQFGFFLDKNGKRVWREFITKHTRPVYTTGGVTVLRVLF